MALLELERVTKRFGGLVANQDISFRVEAGEILGLIGPNGAGKTTLFNCIAGLHPVTAGTIRFDGRDITRLRAHQVARLGLARTFQTYVATGDLTVAEQVMVGCFARTRSPARARAQADAILEELGLAELADAPVRDLPVAAQKRVSMAMALGTRPKLLLLDEVAAGLNPGEVDDMIRAVRHVHQAMGVTVILIEHVMELVMNLSHRVIVLDSGRIIAQGSPQEVVRDPEVIKAYLGERFAQASPEER